MYDKTSSDEFGKYGFVYEGAKDILSEELVSKKVITRNKVISSLYTFSEPVYIEILEGMAYILISNCNDRGFKLFGIHRNLEIKPNFIIVDALEKIDTCGIPYESIIKGDAKCYSIAAASIIAKVTRDRIMKEWDEVYPQYGFAKHKGYGTAAHIAAIRENGLCPIHRRSFTKNFI